MVLFVLRLWGGNVFDRYIVQNDDLILKLLIFFKIVYIVFVRIVVEMKME